MQRMQNQIMQKKKKKKKINATFEGRRSLDTIETGGKTLSGMIRKIAIDRN